MPNRVLPCLFLAALAGCGPPEVYTVEHLVDGYHNGMKGQAVKVTGEAGHEPDGHTNGTWLLIVRSPSRERRVVAIFPEKPPPGIKEGQAVTVSGVVDGNPTNEDGVADKTTVRLVKARAHVK